MLLHPLNPIYDDQSRILILGSFPSVKSRETAFYYGHPQNRFWKLLSAIYGEAVPTDIAEKTAFLHRHQIALWDVIGSCDINGSADASIKNVAPNDIPSLLRQAPIRRILLNGKAAARYYQALLAPAIDKEVRALPSTSPANAACRLPDLIAAWQDALL